MECCAVAAIGGVQAACQALMRVAAKRMPGLQPTLPSPPSATTSGASGAVAAPFDAHPRQGLQPPAGQAGASAEQSCYHVSLSCTAPVRHAQIESLSRMLGQQLRRCQPFGATLGAVRAFVNDEHTRSFLSLAVEEGAEQVGRGREGSAAGRGWRGDRRGAACLRCAMAMRCSQGHLVLY